ncbi:MAG TPA: glycoside hydrolase family 27 protein, partial [Terriglobales bacterium]
MKKHLLLAVILAVALPFQFPATMFAQSTSVSAGLAMSPPMGWNTWNKFGCDVSDQLVRGMADAMVKSGMKDAGYQYIVIDDCWQTARDSKANIVVDPHF